MSKKNRFFLKKKDKKHHLRQKNGYIVNS